MPPLATTSCGRPEVRFVRFYKSGNNVEGLATDCLFEGLEVHRVGAPGTEERIDFGFDGGYERCAPAASTIRAAVASARR